MIYQLPILIDSLLSEIEKGTSILEILFSFTPELLQTHVKHSNFVTVKNISTRPQHQFFLFSRRKETRK